MDTNNQAKILAAWQPRGPLMDDVGVDYHSEVEGIKCVNIIGVRVKIITAPDENDAYVWHLTIPKDAVEIPPTGRAAQDEALGRAVRVGRPGVIR